jgi:cysteine desulfurase
MKFINFDKAASTPLHPAAKRAFLQACQGNPASAHALGREAKAELEQARQAIAHCLNCESDEVYFTSGATEACNWMMYCLSTTGHKVYPFSDVHHAVSEYPVPHARGNEGVSSGNVAASLVNNETGQVCSISPLRAVCGGLIGLDATAAVGHIPMDFKALGADYMAFGGHKFGAPKGIGALIVRRGAPIRPMVYGGAQERGMRGGTTPVPLAAAMAAALEWHTKHMKENMLSVSDVNNELTRYLFILGVKHDNNLPNGAIFAPHILSLRFPGVYGATLAAALSDKGVFVSTGSACSSGSNRPSDVLRAAGLTSQEALSTIRFSFDYDNTEDEARTAAAIIAELIPTLKHD